MSKKTFILIHGGWLLLYILVATSCMNMSISTDYDSSNNFTGYRTFAWAVPTKRYYHVDQNFDNDVVEGNIVAYVHNELFSRGYSLDTTKPDIILSFEIATKNKVRVDQIPVSSQVYQPYYYNNGGLGMNNNYGYNMNDPYNNNMNQMNGGAGGYYTTVTNWTPVNVNYEEGTLTINVSDRSKNRIVWRANAVGTLDDPNSFEAELPDDVKEMFRKYPVSIIKQKKGQ